MGTDTAGATLPWIEKIAESFPKHSFVGFHRVTAPSLIADRGPLVAADIADAPSLAFRLPDGTAFVWQASPNDTAPARVNEGVDGAATIIDLDEGTFSDVINELLTASGAVQTGRARVAQGTIAGWQRWEPAMQSLCTGRPIYSPAVWETLVDRGGEPLDLGHVFSSDDDDADEMTHFFSTAGYLHVRGVFSPDEVTRYINEVEEARRQTFPGDGFSWWSVNASGDEVVTRINHLERFSPAIDELVHDARLQQLATIADVGLRPCDDRLDGPMVFVKNSNVVKGNGDLRWHVDDGSGGHSVMCPLVQVGVQLDHANPENGQLLVLAGSHRYTKHWIAWGEEGELPVVAIETQPGDITLHYGDTMHTTPPPTAPNAGRRALYVKFAEQKTFDWVPSHCHYNDVLFRLDESGRLPSRATTWATSAEY